MCIQVMYIYIATNETKEKPEYDPPEHTRPKTQCLFCRRPQQNNRGGEDEITRGDLEIDDLFVKRKQRVLSS